MELVPLPPCEFSIGNGIGFLSHSKSTGFNTFTKLNNYESVDS